MPNSASCKRWDTLEQLGAIPPHPAAHLWPSEVVTLGLLHALKGVGNRAFYRWLTRDYRPLFPRLPERTRLVLQSALDADTQHTLARLFVHEEVLSDDAAIKVAKAVALLEQIQEQEPTT